VFFRANAQGNNKVFVAFWSNYGFSHLDNNKLIVIDIITDKVIDSVIVGREPNSMVLDHEGKIWALCSGGFASEEKPSLWHIDPGNLEIISSHIFPDINSSPSSLCINGSADTLFFLDQGIFRLAISAPELPTAPLIAEDEHLFYSLAIDPETSIIYTSDAIDYQQRGLILRYQPDGTFVDSFHAGVIPGRVLFNPGSNRK
jgi:YVTN family beta-propeller protein